LISIPVDYQLPSANLVYRGDSIIQIKSTILPNFNRSATDD